MKGERGIMKSTKDKKGFTIIEVVIVLAIAGLIFAIVFWAVPNLQRGNRDNSRRTVVANVLANLDQYASNNNGAYPSADTAGFKTAFLDKYFTDKVEDPLGGEFLTTGTNVALIQYTDIGAQTNFAPRLAYRLNAKCSTNGATVAGSGTRAIAIMIALENGPAYCLDNN